MKRWIDGTLLLCSLAAALAGVGRSMFVHGDATLSATFWAAATAFQSMRTWTDYGRDRGEPSSR